MADLFGDEDGVMHDWLVPVDPCNILLDAAFEMKLSPVSTAICTVQSSEADGRSTVQVG